MIHTPKLTRILLVLCMCTALPILSSEAQPPAPDEAFIAKIIEALTHLGTRANPETGEQRVVAKIIQDAINALTQQSGVYGVTADLRMYIKGALSTGCLAGHSTQADICSVFAQQAVSDENLQAILNKMYQTVQEGMVITQATLEPRTVMKPFDPTQPMTLANVLKIKIQADTIPVWKHLPILGNYDLPVDMVADGLVAYGLNSATRGTGLDKALEEKKLNLLGIKLRMGAINAGISTGLIQSLKHESATTGLKRGVHKAVVTTGVYTLNDGIQFVYEHTPEDVAEYPEGLQWVLSQAQAALQTEQALEQWVWDCDVVGLPMGKLVWVALYLAKSGVKNMAVDTVVTGAENMGCAAGNGLHGWYTERQDAAAG